jgi:hypothetical protein
LGRVTETKRRINLVALLSIIVCVIGLFIYAFAAKPEAKELGRIAYAMGLLAALLQLGGQMVNLLGEGMNAFETALEKLIALGRVSISKYDRLYRVEIVISGNTYDAQSINKLDACIQLLRRVSGTKE